MNWNKERLLKEVRNCELGVKMCEDILMTVSKFEHYAQVNKRFIDALKELGYGAWITKDTYSTTLSVYIGEDYNKHKAEFRYYLSEGFSKKPLTWDGIKNEVARHAFKERLEQAKECLLVNDEETKELQRLIEYVKSKKFRCFDLSSQIWKMEEAIRGY